MTHPKVKFDYSQEKDIWNLRIGLETAHKSRQSDWELRQIIQQCGQSPSEKDLQEYLNLKWEKKSQIMDMLISDLQGYWDSIEGEFFDCLANRTQLSSFFEVKEIKGFFSARYGCGYNYAENYFAVSIHNSVLKNTQVAMHEIMHIFFHKQWQGFCLDRGLSDKDFWNVKEAMTVLLNLWFKNQLVEYDWGYEEHVALRKFIQEKFIESQDFKKTLAQTCEYIKSHQEKSLAHNEVYSSKLNKDFHYFEEGELKSLLAGLNIIELLEHETYASHPPEGEHKHWVFDVVAKKIN